MTDRSSWPWCPFVDSFPLGSRGYPCTHNQQWASLTWMWASRWILGDGWLVGRFILTWGVKATVTTQGAIDRKSCETTGDDRRKASHFGSCEWIVIHFIGDVGDQMMWRKQQSVGWKNAFCAGLGDVCVCLTCRLKKQQGDKHKWTETSKVNYRKDPTPHNINSCLTAASCQVGSEISCLMRTVAGDVAGHVPGERRCLLMVWWWETCDTLNWGHWRLNYVEKAAVYGLAECFWCRLGNACNCLVAQWRHLFWEGRNYGQIGHHHWIRHTWISRSMPF